MSKQKAPDHEPFLADVGRRIVQARKSAGLTQDQLAQKISAGRTSVQQWEKGNVAPGLDQLPKIAEACGVDLPDLLLDNHTQQAREIFEEDQLATVMVAILNLQEELHDVRTRLDKQEAQQHPGGDEKKGATG